MSALHQRESETHQELNLSSDQTQRHIQRISDVIKELKCIAEDRLAAKSGMMSLWARDDKTVVPNFKSLSADPGYSVMGNAWRGSLESLTWFMRYWHGNLSAACDLNRVSLIGSDNLCVANFGLRDIPVERDKALEALRKRVIKYHNATQDGNGNNLFWTDQEPRPGVGYFYALTPVYLANRLQALLDAEQSIRVENLFTLSNLPMDVAILDENGHALISFTDPEGNIKAELHQMQGRPRFGYTPSFRKLVLKKNLPPSSLSIMYSISADLVLGRIRMMILNAILLNVLIGAALFMFTRMYERRIFILVESDAQHLEEHKQLDRKIVAPAPVDTRILHVMDGINVLSNELVHTYLNMLTHEDRQRLTQVICGQQVSFVDVLTSSSTDLQINFVYSRYCNESVAIYALADVSAHVKMEEPLQEMVQATEQTSQSKSMLLAAVSHELHTLLYGIIGNLDLLQTKELPSGADRLAVAMNSSSSLLLKTISGILGFSKIESERLKIEPRELSLREVMNHITINYLPLVIRKQLGLRCFIDPDVPMALGSDPMRLQQVVSNLLSSTIKFIDTGCIVLHVQCSGDYLSIRVCDTGIGIPAKEVVRLFDSFFQVETDIQRNFQGTGLGLAIYEKLISMMDGNVSVDSELGTGSQFMLRIPLYGAQHPLKKGVEGLVGTCCWLAVRNALLYHFLEPSLTRNGMTVLRYEGQRPDADDLLVADDVLEQVWQGRAAVAFCRRHIDVPLEREPEEWVHNVASSYELPALLARIYSVGLGNKDLSTALSAPDKAGVTNDDMMILVVDDHPINRRLLADQLGPLGHQCKTANDGVDALNVLSKSRIDIVLSDVSMSNTDGYHLTQRIRRLGLTLPVMEVTANALAEERQRCLGSSMDGCLSKPVTLDVSKRTPAVYAERVRKARRQGTKELDDGISLIRSTKRA